MKKLRFANKLVYEEISDFFDSVGYELVEDLYDKRTGEKIPSYQILEDMIICRCKQVETHQLHEKIKEIKQKISKVAFNLVVGNLMLRYSEPELIVITDFNCSLFASDDILSEEKELLLTEKLWDILKEKHGAKYDFALNRYLNNLEKNNKDAIETQIEAE